MQCYRLHREDYWVILNKTLSLEQSEEVCRANPKWLVPIQKDVISKIEAHWTEERCLAIQIHCKVGGSEKWQDLINFSEKVYNEGTEEWDRVEMYEGSKVFLPLYPSKGRVSDYRARIAAENPIIQNEDGTAAWLNLSLLVEEAIQNERAKGYLQSRRDLARETRFGSTGEAMEQSTGGASRLKKLVFG